MARNQLTCDEFDGLAGNDLGSCFQQPDQGIFFVDVLFDLLPELIRFDDPRTVEAPGAVDAGGRRNQDQRTERRRDPHAEAHGEFDRVDHIAQHGDVSVVLLQRGGHAFELPTVIVPAQELAFFRDLEARMEVL